MLPYQLHQKLRAAQAQQQQSSSSNLSVLKGLPFWIWDKEIHREQAAATNGNCCFNHAVSLPQKEQVYHPMYDYEKLLYDALMSNVGSFKDRHLWCLSTGLGVSEFFLRLMAWLCTSTDDYKNSQMVVVTGPNLSLAVKLMKRLKGIFSSKLGIYFTNKETMIELYGCEIEAYPSNHIHSFRSLTNPKFILLDETDFWIRAEDNKSVTKERHRWTKAERQYIQGIVHNYSLQRWTKQAENWYIALRESGSKYVAVYKERLDSLLIKKSYTNYVTLNLVPN